MFCHFTHFASLHVFNLTRRRVDVVGQGGLFNLTRRPVDVVGQGYYQLCRWTTLLPAE